MSAELWREVQAAIRRGEVVAVATITRTWGHSPRGAGARMLVFRDGRTMGTVGGGCGEAEVRLAALQVLDSGAPTLFAVNLTDDYKADEGSICGGKFEVFVEPIHPGKWEDSLVEVQNVLWF